MPSTTADKLVAKIERAWIEVIPDTDPDTSWLEQDEFADRLEAYRRDEFSFVGVRACAELRFETPQGGWERGPVVSTSGLWGIESDSGDDYLTEVGREQADELPALLQALGFSRGRADYARRIAYLTLHYR